MKNYLHYMLFFIIMTTYASAGPFELFNQNDTVQGTIQSNTLDAYAQIRNTTNETVNFNISMKFLKITEGHAAALCWETCFAYIDQDFTSPDTYSLGPNEESIMTQFSGHLQPYKLDPVTEQYTFPAEGTTIVRYTFAPVSGNTEDELHYDVVFIVGNPNSVDNIETLGSSLYPNPATDHISIDFDQPMTNNAKAYIYDLLGNTVNVTEIKSGEKKCSIEINNFPAGTYNFTYFDGSRNVSKMFNVIK